MSTQHASASAAGRTLDPQPRGAHQGLIDAEMRASRRAVLDAYRQRLLVDVTTLAAADFLALADPRTVHEAVILAAGTVADACTLQQYDPDIRMLRVVASRGVPDVLLRHLASADASADAVALADEGPPLPANGFKAVHAHPLRGDDNELLGLLWLLSATAASRRDQERLARAAARAMAAMAALRHSSPAAAPPSPAAATFTVHRTGDAVTLAVHGALDSATVPAFADHIRQAVFAEAPTLLIDLREVDLLAVAGVRALLDASRLCAARSTACYLVAGADHTARTVIDRLGATALLRIVEDAALITPDRAPRR
ncbi:STAS domain-containing protein [Dactylosporangium sp. CS-033363]|uniref:STAS domain-containing protein n=1 Tax=Dactylosporangium sp. CS-033363 TaxID=3239935 RepID=UPI003D8AC2ED